MRTPGFGAENALYRSNQRYTADSARFARRPDGGTVVMAIPIDGGNPRRECLDDCIDTCTTGGSSVQACRTKCGRLCQGGPGIPSPAPDPANHAICVGGCQAWWVACLLESSVLGFASEFCDYVRDQCLSGCP